MTAGDFASIEISKSYSGGNTRWILSIHLDDEGSEILRNSTEKALGERLAFILDNRLLYVAEIDSQTTNGMTELNLKDYTKRELENITVILESEK